MWSCALLLLTAEALSGGDWRLQGAKTLGVKLQLNEVRKVNKNFPLIPCNYM